MSKTYSLLRRAQYEELKKFKIDGNVLDLGGARRSGYHELIGGAHTIHVANIQAGDDVDLVFDAEKEFPIDDETYSAVICLNVLEHVFEYQHAVNESFRVLKKDGVLIGSTPFLHAVHGSPDDYFRYTRSAFEKIFRKAGFREVEIKELGTGAFGVIHELLSGLYRLGFIKEILKYQTVFDKLLWLIKKDNKLTEKFMPLGYFFVARKP
jgi:SAM-dependent methyltransferase